ncbi:19246_t:CDS:2, partial [Funneliformis geosporum]
KKLAQIFRLDEQNAKVYKRRVKRLEKDVRFLKDELKGLDEC